MKNEALIKQTQSIVYQTLVNAFSSNKINHAFLLSGLKGSPIKESAIYVAQSLVCENPSPLACEECLSCLRIANQSYADFIYIDGELGTIKKEEIENLQSSFSKSGVEAKGLKIYIINQLEKATASATNSLLKFLEEPYDDVVGILTTQNQSQVLDTIVSRTQVLRIKTYSKDYLVTELLNSGINQEDVNILVSKYSDINQILEVMNNTDYPAIKALAIETFTVLVNEPDSLNFFAINQLNPKIADKKSVVLFLDLLETLITDVVKLNIGENIVFSNQNDILNKALNKRLNYQKLNELIMLAQGSVGFNLNVGLLLDNLFYQIRYEGNE
jgi:DNA polymerase III subunit delta'